MTPMTHTLLRDIEGKNWHLSLHETAKEKPKQVPCEWVRAEFGEKVYQILKKDKRVNLTIH